MNYETVIGLEVHVQLNTASKMFCGCSTRFGVPPNTQVCPVCLGFPGALPVINKQAMRLAITTALALHCTIARFTKFDRKHYYYPDLPKNFQISQYDKPLSYDGMLEIETSGSSKKINLKRIHLEEDAGKLIHQEGGDYSLVDYNRAGTPLMEIVTQPDIRSPDEAYEFLTKLKGILEYVEVSDCNMEEGSLRCDANISIRPAGQTALGTKTEVKNMNSFKAVRQALEYEAKRQRELLATGKTIVQETRLWDSDRQLTDSMRSKEEAHDYRYFPEPDLPPLVVSKEHLDEIRRSLPELPAARFARFVTSYGLSEYEAGVLTADKAAADYFEETVKTFSRPKIVANWVMGDLAALVSSTGLSFRTIGVRPTDLSGLLMCIEDNSASAKMAKEALKISVESGKAPKLIIQEKGTQISDVHELMYVIEKVITLHPKVVADFKSGKQEALTFLVGQVMKETKGKAHPKLANDLLLKKLREG